MPRKKSSYAKGKTNQARTIHVLEAAGYFVETAKTMKFQPEDFYGLFDHIAIRRDGKEIRFIQTKTGYARPEVKEAIKEFPFLLGSKEIWVWKDGEEQPDIIFL